MSWLWFDERHHKFVLIQYCFDQLFVQHQENRVTTVQSQQHQQKQAFIPQGILVGK